MMKMDSKVFPRVHSVQWCDPAGAELLFLCWHSSSSVWQWFITRTVSVLGHLKVFEIQLLGIGVEDEKKLVFFSVNKYKAIKGFLFLLRNLGQCGTWEPISDQIDVRT